MLNKEAQYTALYFPESMIDDKEKAYFALLDVDSNFSKLIQGLLPDIINACNTIISEGNNFRHYDWRLTIKRKSNGKRNKAEISKDMPKV